MSDVEAPEPPAAEPPSTWIVRHGAMRLMGVFTVARFVAVKAKDRAIVVTERGHEMAEVLCPATPKAAAVLPDPTRGEILRIATAEDLAKQTHWETVERPKDYDLAASLIARHKLLMQLVDVERLFGGERILFYFLAENRVDFRELVKTLAREFKSRIELRQIGARDEAKLLADFGDCGKPVCCNTHMAVMPPVSMRMAKLQKATLDPNKISGRCGRLKCCLRFEQDVYDEQLEQLPQVGAKIRTAQGTARVLAQEILAKKLLVEYDDGRRVAILASDVVSEPT
jgi:cell fate regulator YaaT (PSP1 superfamily)